jgi:hypothetical protein
LERFGAIEEFCHLQEFQASAPCLRISRCDWSAIWVSFLRELPFYINCTPNLRQTEYSLLADSLRRLDARFLPLLTEVPRIGILGSSLAGFWIDHVIPRPDGPSQSYLHSRRSVLFEVGCLCRFVDAQVPRGYSRASVRTRMYSLTPSIALST